MVSSVSKPCSVFLRIVYVISQVRGLSQIMFALRVGRWSEKRVVHYIKSSKFKLGAYVVKKFQKMQT